MGRKLIASLILFVAIFVALFEFIFPKTIIQYDLKLKHIQYSAGLKGTIFTANKGGFSKKKSKYFIFYNTTDSQRVNIYLYDTIIQNLRLDPTSSKNTEMEISNMVIKRGWRDSIPFHVPLDKVSKENSSQIKIIQAAKNSLHFISTHNDPKIFIKVPYEKKPPLLNYIYEILLAAFLSLLLTIYFMYEFFLRHEDK